MSPRSSARGRRRGVPVPGAHPTVTPPPGLEALRLDLDGDAFALLSWPRTIAAMPRGLTAAEREVAALVADGLSNREIADRRCTSERTVANQVASVLRKTAAASRAGLFALLARGGDGGPERA